MNFPRIGTESRPSVEEPFQWITRGTPPSTHELQGLPRGTWQLVNEFRSLKIINDVLQKGRPLNFQQFIPVSLVPQVLNSIHSSTTGGYQGKFTSVRKVLERIHWPGFQQDMILLISRCGKCQKSANTSVTHHHFLVEWTPSCPFHHNRIIFTAPLPLSNDK